MNAFRWIMIMFCINAGLLLTQAVMPMAGMETGYLPSFDSKYFDAENATFSGLKFMLDFVLGTAGIGIAGIMAATFIAARNTTIAGAVLFSSAFWAGSIGMLATIDAILNRALDPLVHGVLYSIILVWMGYIWINQMVQFTTGGQGNHV